MPFRTKLDYSNNRQIKQHPANITYLSGGTSFGVPFSALTSGPDTNTSGVTQTLSLVSSSFSGNLTTTIFTWYDAGMAIGESSVSAITPSNSATTQHIGPIFTADTSTVIDGNTVILNYTGVTFPMVVTSMIDLGGSNYSGTVLSNSVKFLSAGTLDYTGRTIWVDVSGITRTTDLILSKAPQVGFVWTCIDTEGKGAWQASSGGTSATTYWSASTGLNAIAMNYSDSISSGVLAIAEGSGNTALGSYAHAEGNFTHANGSASHAEGHQTTAGGTYSHAEGDSTTTTIDGAHAEGFGGVASGFYSHVEGVNSIASNFAAHAEGEGTLASGVDSHAEGNLTTASGEGSHAEGFNTLASGMNSHAEGGYHTAGINGGTASGAGSHAQGFVTTSSGQASHAEGSGTTASGNLSHAGGEFTIVTGTTSYGFGKNHNVNANFSAILGGTGNTISYGADMTAIIAGSGITATQPNMVYVPDLIIDGLINTDPLATDANGKIVAGTSDARLKTNVATLANALEVIKNIRGVSFEYTKESNMGGGIRYGFIAQEVQNVVPSIVRDRAKGDGMLSLNYTEIIPLLVEAVKELSTGTTTQGGVYLETQTILAEDNDIQLNFSGNQQTSIGGGVRVLHAMGQDQEAEFITDENGNWITNNDVKPKALTIPYYTPSSSNDSDGNVGNITRDDNYIYIKTKTGWKRSSLENF